MNDRRIATSVAILVVALATPVSAMAQPSESNESVPGAPSSPAEQPSYGGGIQGQADVADGSVTVGVGASIDGTPGADGSVETAGGDPEPAPQGVWITVSDMVFVTDPPCIRTTSQFLEGVSQGEADVIRWTQENQFVTEYEAYISGGNEAPPPCPTPDGSPGIDPTPAQQYADDAESILPVANPSISGGYAITGLRSWLDLGRPGSFTDSRTLDLGPFTRTATFTATATATVDWGDGTVIDTTARGGAYHEGEPTADDITHIYRDRSDSTTLTVTDSWEILVTVPGLSDIRLTYTAEPIAVSFPVREVRSSRDR